MTGMEPTGLVGLVLAGGQSRRMGSDKGSLELDGQTLAERALALVAPFSETAVVSVREAQADLEPYRRLPVVIDDARYQGPAAGLIAAWVRFPARPLLVLAADLAGVDRSMLGDLVAGRDPAVLATVFRHPNGLLEPLCTIWEAAAAARLRAVAGDDIAPSLRQLLEDGPVHVLEPAEPARLASANTPAELAAVRAAARPD